MNNSSNNNGWKLYLIIAVLLLALGALLWDKLRPNQPINQVTPAPIVSAAPAEPFKVNKPLETQKEKVATGNLKKEDGKIVVRDNDKPVKVVVPPTNVNAGDSNVAIRPTTPQATGSQEFTIPAGGGTIELPEQKWTLTIEREYSPFRANVYLYPSPQVGFGYDLVTLNLNEPFGLGLKLGTLSAGPFLTLAILSDSYYIGGEIVKSLGRVNANLGYGWEIGTGDGQIVAGLSFNFR